MIDVSRLLLEDFSTFTDVYVIGDIHGRLDLLDKMETAIAADIAIRQPVKPLICYLGDYIDRGPDSAGVIERLSSPESDGVARAFLKGNHEDRMIDFLVEPSVNGPAWMTFGGREALASYGLTVPRELEDFDWIALRDRLDAALPARHRAFLNDLLLGIRWGDYLFVHAGLKPEHPVTAQSPRDLMWIREPFLSSECDWGFVVVHGHVIVEEPEFRANRIGIDTGAYQTGRLTCLALSHDGYRLLQP